MVAKQAEAKQVLWEEFQKLDTSGDGVLDRGEFEALLGGRAVAKIVGSVGHLMEEFDKDGDGRVSFDEFCQVLTGDRKPPRYEVGQALEYFSTSNGRWIPCRVTAVHPKGHLQIDCKPGGWLKVDEPKLR